MLFNTRHILPLTAVHRTCVLLGTTVVFRLYRKIYYCYFLLCGHRSCNTERAQPLFSCVARQRGFSFQGFSCKIKRGNTLPSTSPRHLTTKYRKRSRWEGRQKCQVALGCPGFQEPAVPAVPGAGPQNPAFFLGRIRGGPPKSCLGPGTICGAGEQLRTLTFCLLLPT